ncbi:hypothetical protein [Streptomyces sp. NPDC002758]
MTDVVELKVTVSPQQARQAGIWNAAGRGLDRRIWFCEQSGASPGRLPLLDSGVVLRLRETRPWPDESTARLRPCRRSRLTAALASAQYLAGECLDAASVWSGDRRVLSVSVTARHTTGTVARTVAQGGPTGPLFTAGQRDFLAECADRRVPYGRVTALGPVAARWWPRLVWSRMSLTVERWEVTAASGARLDFVELSRRVRREGAEIAQLALESSLRRRGVDPAECEQGSKTRRVLELLTSTDQGISPKHDAH